MSDDPPITIKRKAQEACENLSQVLETAISTALKHGRPAPHVAPLIPHELSNVQVLVKSAAQLAPAYFWSKEMIAFIKFVVRTLMGLEMKGPNVISRAAALAVLALNALLKSVA